MSRLVLGRNVEERKMKIFGHIMRRNTIHMLIRGRWKTSDEGVDV